MSMLSLDQISQRSDVNEFKARKSGPYLEGNLKLLDCIECPADIMCCRFSPDGSYLAVGLCDGCIKIYGSNSAQTLYSLSDDDTNASRLPVTQIRFLTDTHSHGEQFAHEHRLMACYASGLVKFWHYTSGKCLHTINELRQTLALTINPMETHFLTAGASNEIHLYDLETKKMLNTMKPSESHDIMDGHVCRVFALQYNVNHQNIFISGGWDDTVQYWDDREKHSIKKFHGPHICGDALDIDPQHNHILTGSWRKNTVLQIWDFAMAVKIKDVPQDSLNASQLYCAQWLGKDSIMCGGNDLNMARMIDRGTLNTTGTLVDLPQGVYCIDNDHSPHQPRIAVGSNRFIYRLQSSKSN
ncbi:WD repeat-containing protein 89 homolog [Babylonia areolata]|uniref:WD repeat-containing protein 89 homolog n=1 Tax=Babylonia areolata TaxID=304850 RepID=UPI003FCFA932